MKKEFSITGSVLSLIGLLGIAALVVSAISRVFGIDGSLLSVLALFMPPLVIFNILFLLVWLYLGKFKFFSIRLVILLISWGIFGGFYQFNNEIHEKKGGSFTVLSFNVRGFNRNEIIKREGVDKDIFDFIKKQDADVLCIQEASILLKWANPLDSIYPHKYVDFNLGNPNKTVMLGFYSKYPILEPKAINFPNSGNRALTVTIDRNGKPFQIFQMHLQSFRVIPKFESLKDQGTQKLITRVGRTVEKQNQQIDIVLEEMKKAKMPKILLGDLNNTQFSNVYKKAKGDLQDTFLEAGKGFGRTYELFGIPLRIDMILADDTFKVLSHTNFDVELSDHYPVMAELELKK